MSYTDLDPDYYERQQRMVEIDQSILSMTNAMRANLDLPPIQSESVDFGRKARVHAEYDNTMQFADPDWQPDPRRVLKLDLSTHEGRVEASKQLFSASGNPWSDFTIVTHMPEADPELLYTVYDSESSHWVDVPFHVAWLFYGAFMLVGQLLVFGFSTTIFHWPLGIYTTWGILNLLALPFLSYWWTKHARDRHYAKNGLLQETRAR